MNGQCLHFEKLNSRLGPSSMGITVAGQGQGQGTWREPRQKRVQVLALVGWGGEGKVGRELNQQVTQALAGGKQGRSHTAETERGALGRRETWPMPTCHIPDPGPQGTIIAWKGSLQGPFTPALTFPQSSPHCRCRRIYGPPLFAAKLCSPWKPIPLLLHYYDYLH